MTNTSAKWQQAACTTYHHLLAAQQERYKKPDLLKKNHQKNQRILREYSGEKGMRMKKNDKPKTARGLSRKMREEIGEESNDSPDIPDRRVTSDILNLP